MNYKLIPFENNDLNIDLNVNVEISSTTLEIRYELSGDLNHIEFKILSNSPVRKDDLWKETCFELFLGADNGQYLEFNFNTKNQWNAYHFSTYREGMSHYRKIELNHIQSSTDKNTLILQVELSVDELSKYSAKTQPTAVILTKGQKAHYYALKHNSEQPDFHTF